MEWEHSIPTAPEWAANEIGRLKTELADARRALLAGNDTVLANKKLQEDSAAKDARIAIMREALELVDADVRHHLRSDAIDHALLRKHAVAAVRAALAPFPTGLVTVPALTPDQEAHLKTLEPRPYDPDTMIRGSSPAGREG